MERISGPSTGSTFGNLSNGNTASLAPWWLNFLSLSFKSSSFAPSIRRVARRAHGDRSAYSLTLASDDSLRRVAYGSRACYKPWRPEAPCGKILLWAFPHIYVRSGYILGAITFASLVTRLLKRSLAPENIKTKLSASLRPKGSLSLTQKGQAYARPNSHKRYLLAISMIYCIMEQIAIHPASATICIRAIVN